MLVRQLDKKDPYTTEVIRRKKPQDVQPNDMIFGSGGNLSQVLEAYEESEDTWYFITEHAGISWHKHAFVKVLETITHIPLLGIDDAAV